MALVKCKECGEQVSTKAKTCPKCGAKSPKKTSPITWLVFALIIFGIYGANQSPSTYASPPNVKSSNPKAIASASIITAQPKKLDIPKSTWGHVTSKDEMTGVQSAYASSRSIEPSKRMGFPYGDTKAWLGVGCDGKREWAYVGFNNAPNLSETATEDGYNHITTRIKWDSKIENVTLTQDWGASFIHFRDDKSVVSKIANSNSVLLELKWHGQQQTYFEFPLSGSSSALKKIRHLCSK